MAESEPIDRTHVSRSIGHAMEIPFTFMLRHGLHARPASVLAEAARRVKHAVTLVRTSNGARADARSVLSLVAMDVQLNDACVLEIEPLPGTTPASDDAALRATIEALHAVIDARFGDAEDALAVSDHRGTQTSESLPEGLRELGAHCVMGRSGGRGIGEGTALVLRGRTMPDSASLPPSGQADDELAKFRRALLALLTELGTTQQPWTSPTDARPDTSVGSSTAADLRSAHRSILQDPELQRMIERAILRGDSAARATCAATATLAARLRGVASEYIRERAMDVEDLGGQLVSHILGPSHQVPRPNLAEPTVVVAESLSPSELIELATGNGRENLRGLVLGPIGPTSHTMIVARSMRLPVVTHIGRGVGTGGKRQGDSQVNSPGQSLVEGVEKGETDFRSGTPILVDANKGLVVISPSESIRRYVQVDHRIESRARAGSSSMPGEPAHTRDGVRLEIGANVGSAAEIPDALAEGAEGIGLFRSELMYFDRTVAPSEEEQFAAFRDATLAVAECSGCVIIRTLDIGGDKPVQYLGLPREENPFMGCRGVRLYPRLAPTIHNQLRAICRASAFGAVKVMAPMIATLAEADTFVFLVREVQKELHSQGIAFDPHMPIGMMIEVPSAVMIVDQLAASMDFFSIGTNDLGQYWTAADRGNAAVASLNDPLNPSFIRALKHIVDQCRNNPHGRRWVGVCGEMAADPANIPLFVGLGVDEISMSTGAIGAVRAALAGADSQRCASMVARALQTQGPEVVRTLLADAVAAEHDAPPLSEALISINSTCGTRAEVLREVAAMLTVAGRASQATSVESGLWTRERTYSTGLGHGLAIPHCKHDAVLTTSIAVVRLNKPIEWDSASGTEPVDMIVSLAVRGDAQDRSHMQILAKLARKLVHDEFRASLRSADDPGKVISILREELGIPR